MLGTIGVIPRGILAALGAVTCFIGRAGRWRGPATVGAIVVAIAAVGLLPQWPFEDVIRLSDEVMAAALFGTSVASLIAWVARLSLGEPDRPR
jgi:hypothetical protein